MSAKFYCCSPKCPGYAYKASDMAHPRATCGDGVREVPPPAISAEQAWKERALEAERKLLDYEGKPMLYSGRTELAAFKKREATREPLVQEVIAASKHLSSLTKYNSGYLAFQDAEMALAKACQALAEWKGGAT